LQLGAGANERKLIERNFSISDFILICATVVPSPCLFLPRPPDNGDSFLRLYADEFHEKFKYTGIRSPISSSVIPGRPNRPRKCIIELASGRASLTPESAREKQRERKKHDRYFDGIALHGRAISSRRANRD